MRRLGLGKECWRRHCWTRAQALELRHSQRNKTAECATLRRWTSETIHISALRLLIPSSEVIKSSCEYTPLCKRNVPAVQPAQPTRLRRWHSRREARRRRSQGTCPAPALPCCTRLAHAQHTTLVWLTKSRAGQSEEKVLVIPTHHGRASRI